jgi:hypothetical protein
MNDFYKQPKTLQWIEAILLLLIGFSTNMDYYTKQIERNA